MLPIKYMFRFSFTTSVGEYSVKSIKARNYNDAGIKARIWCDSAKCKFLTITRVNK